MYRKKKEGDNKRIEYVICIVRAKHEKKLKGKMAGWVNQIDKTQLGYLLNIKKKKKERIG